MPGKFIEGRTLIKPPGGFASGPPNIVAAANSPTHFDLVNCDNYQINESSGILKKTSQIVVGSNTIKTHRNFRWLPWIPGKISYAPLQGDDILTGTFTGCWAVIFSMGGVDYVGHIGTDLGPNTANSIQVKAAWCNEVGKGTVTPIKAYNPVTSLPGNVDLSKLGGPPDIYAILTSTQDLYVVVMVKKSATAGTEEMGKVCLVTGTTQPPFT